MSFVSVHPARVTGSAGMAQRIGSADPPEQARVAGSTGLIHPAHPPAPAGRIDTNPLPTIVCPVFLLQTVARLSQK